MFINNLSFTLKYSLNILYFYVYIESHSSKKWKNKSGIYCTRCLQDNFDYKKIPEYEIRY